MNNYPPLVLDDTAIPLPNEDGVGYHKVKEARSAFYWWIICSIQLVERRRDWAKEVLGVRKEVSDNRCSASNYVVYIVDR
jgi:hypothetical protein